MQSISNKTKELALEIGIINLKSHPTQEGLKERIRKDLNYHINIKHKPWNQRFSYIVTGSYYAKNNGRIIDRTFNNFNSYEAALEDGLQEILKYTLDPEGYEKNHP